MPPTAMPPAGMPCAVQGRCEAPLGEARESSQRGELRRRAGILALTAAIHGLVVTDPLGCGFVVGFLLFAPNRPNRPTKASLETPTLGVCAWTPHPPSLHFLLDQPSVASRIQ